MLCCSVCSGQVDGGSVAGLAVYSCLIFAMQIKVCLSNGDAVCACLCMSVPSVSSVHVAVQVSEETATWCKWNGITMLVSIVGYFVFVLVYNAILSTSPEFYGVAVILFKRDTFWLCLCLVCGIVVLVDYVVEHLRRTFVPTPVDVAMEIERCGGLCGCGCDYGCGAVLLLC